VEAKPARTWGPPTTLKAPKVNLNRPKGPQLSLAEQLAARAEAKAKAQEEAKEKEEKEKDDDKSSVESELTDEDEE
jgi:hypothetical protein